MAKTTKKGGAAYVAVVVSPSEIARKAGVSPATAYRVLKYKDRQPSWKLACKIADSMGWSLDTLREHLERAA